MDKKSSVTKLQPVEIVEPLENVLAEECSTAILECKIKGFPQPTCQWFKDGKIIVHTNRIEITANGKWHRLVIKSVISSDYGIYNIVCDNNISKTFSGATLYVRLKSDGINEGLIIYSDLYLSKSLAVVRHLLPVKVYVGDTIELNALFKTDAITSYIWYKSNNRLLCDDRITIISAGNTSTVYIKSAEATDTGVYFVVAKTKHGLASSSTDVYVVDNSNKPLKQYTEELPYIIDALSYEFETNENEEIRLVCKAALDCGTNIQWLKNNVPIQDNRLIPEIYNGVDIGLRIVEPRLTDAGEYSLVLKNKNTGRCDSTKCYLTVNPCPVKKLSKIQKGKLLNSIVASIGSKVSFECSYILDDPTYYYVVWYVGNLRVERTNSRFEVLYNGGSFLLYIKQVESIMAGEVTCELRRALPNRRSVLINSISAKMTIVPSIMLEESCDLPDHTICRKKIFCEKYSNSVKTSDNDELKSRKQRQMYRPDFNGNKCIEESIIECVLLEFTYCRLEDAGFFYLDVSYGEKDVRVIVRTSTYDNNNSIQDTHVRKDKRTEYVAIEWDDIVTDTISCMWYGVDICQNNGDYVEAGVSSHPVFELKDPPLKKIMKFRIRTVIPLKNASESTLCIMPHVNAVTEDPKKFEYKSVDQFDDSFTKTGDMIGCGAFGSVILVRNNTGEYFAAKMLKTRTQKKRDTALRECEIMMKLRHPKLVKLEDVFISKDSCILVMDYLWGGELFDRIVEEDHIKEIDVVPYVKQICEALLYLHQLKIAHLDLKPENIICLSPNSRKIKIIDFGLARVLKEGQATRAIYGTREYVAPEVLNFEELTLACDMWSLGVVTYTLLSGVMPFAGDTWPERSANITMANYNYEDIVFREISDLAKNFVDRLLVIKADQRMSAVEALSHQWIVQGPPKGAKAGYMKRTRENLKTYLANYRARWQRAGNVMIAARRLRTHAGTVRCGDVMSSDGQTVSQRIT